MSITVKDKIIQLLSENHSDWDNSVNIDDFNKVIPMLESLCQSELIQEYIQLFEDEPALKITKPKVDPLDQLGLKKPQQKNAKNQHFLDSDKIKSIDNALVKLQKIENNLRSEINSKQTLAQGQSPDVQKKLFAEIASLKSNLADVAGSIADRQAEKKELINALDKAGESAGVAKPNYRQIDKGTGRKLLSAEEIDQLHVRLGRLTKELETVTTLRNSIRKNIGQSQVSDPAVNEIKKKIDQVQFESDAYTAQLNSAIDKIDQHYSGSASGQLNQEKLMQAQTSIASLSKLLDDSNSNLDALHQQLKQLLPASSADIDQKLDSIKQHSSRISELEHEIEKISNQIKFDSAGKDTSVTPVQAISQSSSPKQSVISQFKDKLQDLLNQFNSMLTDAELTASNESTTVSGELSKLISNFYKSQKTSRTSDADGGQGASFKSNPLSGVGTDLINQLSLLVKDVMARGTDSTQKVLANIVSNSPFSSSSQTPGVRFLTDLKAMYQLLNTVKTQSETDTRLRVGKDFLTFVDSALEDLDKFKSVSPSVKKSLADETNDQEASDDTEINTSIDTYNRSLLIKTAQYFNNLIKTSDLLLSKPKLSQSVADQLSKVVQQDVDTGILKLNDMLSKLENYANTIGNSGFAKDPVVKNIHRLLSLVEENKKITDYINGLTRTSTGYQLPDGRTISTGNLKSLISKHKNNKGDYLSFVTDVKQDAALQKGALKKSNDRDTSSDTVNISTRQKMTDIDPEIKKDWNKLSIRK